MKVLNKEKRRIVIFCEQVLKDAEREAERESINFIQGFESKKKHVYRKLDSLRTHDDNDQYEEGLLKDIEQLEDDLMSVEMKLQESLAESTTNYEDRVKKVILEMGQATES